MRRLWAYIILAFTAIVAMGASFVNVLTKVRSNIEYSEGREIVFRISEKDDDTSDFENEDAVKNIANKMIERLNAQDVTQYRVSTQGYDTITVELKQDTINDYENIKTLLSFNGSLALTSKLNDSLIGDEFLSGSKSYIKSEQDVPSLNIPVGNKVQELITKVKGYMEGEGANPDAGETSGEGEDQTTSYFLYLWHDYDPDYDTFEKTVSSNEEYDEHVAKKIFMKFDVTAIEDGATTLKSYVNIQDANNNQKYEASEVKTAWNNAKLYCNLLNSGELDYKVTYIYDNVVPAWSDELIKVGNNIAWSNTLIATLVGMIIISLILVVFTRLTSVSIIVSTLGSIFGALGMVVLFSAEFNAAALIGFIIVAIASLASGVINSVKFKEECYRGRSLKKANSEAAKKSMLPIVDVHVAIIAVGIFSYLIGGAIMRGFSIVTVLGGLVSLISNLVVLRLMNWLATNTTALQGNYEIFGIDKNKVPNVIKEEKQNYYGPYADRTLTKHKKPVGIAAAVLLVAGLTGCIVFGAMNKGVVYNNGSKTLNSQIYIETENKNTLVNLTAVEEALSDIQVYQGSDEAKAKSLDSFVAIDSNKLKDIVYKTREDTDPETKVTTTYTYYVVQLSSNFDASKYNGFYYADEAKTNKVYSTDGLEALVQDRLSEFDTDVRVSMKMNTIASAYQPVFMPIVWSTLAGIAVVGAYLLLRYRLSRGIVAILAPIATSTIVAGLFALTRLPVTSYAALAIPFTAIITLILSIIFMNRERELILEDKAHDRSFDNRNAIMEKSTSYAFYPMLIVIALAVYLCINFFGFGAPSNSWMFLIAAIACVVALCVVTVLFGPLSMVFYKLFSGINTEKFKIKKPKKKAKKTVTKTKSAEPEEYIFIGIND